MPYSEFIATYPELKLLSIEERMIEYDNYINDVMLSLED